MDYRAALRWGCSCENRFVSKWWHRSLKTLKFSAKSILTRVVERGGGGGKEEEGSEGENNKRDLLFILTTNDLRGNRVTLRNLHGGKHWSNVHRLDTAVALPTCSQSL